VTHATLGCPGTPALVWALAAVGFVAALFGALAAYVAVGEPLVDRLRAPRRPFARKED